VAAGAKSVRDALIEAGKVGGSVSAPTSKARAHVPSQLPHLVRLSLYHFMRNSAFPPILSLLHSLGLGLFHLMRRRVVRSISVIRVIRPTRLTLVIRVISGLGLLGLLGFFVVFVRGIWVIGVMRFIEGISAIRLLTFRVIRVSSFVLLLELCGCSRFIRVNMFLGL
jgi:hypothetical protein